VQRIPVHRDGKSKIRFTIPGMTKSFAEGIFMPKVKLCGFQTA